MSLSSGVSKRLVRRIGVGIWYSGDDDGADEFDGSGSGGGFE